MTDRLNDPLPDPLLSDGIDAEDDVDEQAVEYEDGMREHADLPPDEDGIAEEFPVEDGTIIGDPPPGDESIIG